MKTTHAALGALLLACSSEPNLDDDAATDDATTSGASSVDDGAGSSGTAAADGQMTEDANAAPGASTAEPGTSTDVPSASDDAAESDDAAGGSDDASDANAMLDDDGSTGANDDGAAINEQTDDSIDTDPTAGMDASDDPAPADGASDEDSSSDDAPAADELNTTLLDELTTYLEQDQATRPAIETQAFASVPLSEATAARAAELLWEDTADHVRAERQAEHDARQITIGDATLRFDYTIFGEAPPSGRSLYISLHGGGNAAPEVNDSQWENQKILYEPDEGVYLAPRAPTDTWNLWHEAHIDPLFERLITNLIVFEGVDPNRVYVMGYSAGGDGVYQLGPRMADHWAAAAAMAGHPNEAKPLSLRNIGFTVHVGALDTDYDRNQVAQEWSDQLDSLEADDPGGYRHVVEIHPGKPHWMDLEDAVAVPWMAEFTRNPIPDRIVWYQDDITHARSYWLAVDEPRGETTIIADREGQTIAVTSSDVSDARVRLRDDMLDLDEPVSISFNEAEVFSGIPPRTVAVLAATLAEREDPALMFSSEIPLDGN